MDPLTIAALSGLFLSAGVVHRLTGMGFALVVVPPLVALLGPHDGVTLGAAGALLAAVGVGVQTRAVIDRSVVRILIPAVVVGSVVGLVISLVVAEHWLTVGIAAAILVSVVLAVASRLRTYRSPRRHIRRTLAMAGVVSGAMNATSAIGGPALSVAASWSGMAHAVFVSTVQIPFIVMGVVGVGGRLIALSVPQLSWWGWLSLAAATGIGLAIGSRVGRFVSDWWGWIATLAVAAVGAVLLLVGVVS